MILRRIDDQRVVANSPFLSILNAKRSWLTRRLVRRLERVTHIRFRAAGRLHSVSMQSPARSSTS